jgi:hypothetical protein
MDIESEGEPQLKLAWREMDGRPVAPPEEGASAAKLGLPPDPNVFAVMRRR